MTGYPKVLSEDETLDRALAGASISRFGDGELRLARGGNCISQRETSPKLEAELQAILAAPPTSACLVGIPNIEAPTPKAESWARYGVEKFASLYKQKVYASAFITRPDSAPWIDRPDYWARVPLLWQGADVVLVSGGRNGLKPEQLAGAASVRTVYAPEKNAYSSIDAIEAAIGRPAGTVILCLGPTATVLAWRMAKKGVRALDLGHIGMFMKHAGAYRVGAGELLSPAYRAELAALHRAQRWGADGGKHAEMVAWIADAIGAATILDYGAGRGALAEALAPRRIAEYEPAIAEKAGMPKPADLVVSTDVLEHVEPEKLPAVLDHIFRLAGKAVYLVIATRPANAILPSGRNAHLIVEGEGYWLEKLNRVGWSIARSTIKPDRELSVWLTRQN